MAKQGGSGPTNQIGEVSIGTSLDQTGLNVGLRQAETTTKTAGTRMGASLGGIRGLFSKLFIPVAVFGSVSRMISMLDEAQQESKRFREELENTRKSFSDPINVSAYALRAGVNQYDVMRAELLKKAQETRDAIDKLAEQKLTGFGRLLDQNTLSNIPFLRDLFKTMSGDDIRKEVERQQKAMTDAVEQGLKNIADDMAKKMAEVLKDFLDKQKDQSSKLLESIAISAARSAQIAESMQASQSRGAH